MPDDLIYLATKQTFPIQTQNQKSTSISWLLQEESFFYLAEDLT